VSIRRDALETVRPSREGRDGPLPPLLLLLTVATGVVDAVSYLKLGHVFVANMTGNVVFLGFALAGASGLSTPASLVALGAFLAGGVAGGRLGSARAEHRGLLLRDSLALQLSLIAAAVAVAGLGGAAPDEATRYAMIVLLAVAMGIQNATVRRLAVPDLTTTVLTMTLTGVAADSRLARGPGSRIARRALSVLAMLLGALIGALLALKVDNAASLGVALALVAIAALAVHAVSQTPADWVLGKS
jgi:uncharacterized membrane protein YoaK (UPF0700 family)